MAASHQARQTRLLIIIAVLLGLTGLKLLEPVLMPLVIALFIITIGWPINEWLKAIFPKRVSQVLSYVALIGILGVFVGVFYLAATDITQQFPNYQDSMLDTIKQISSALRQYGIPVPHDITQAQIDQLVKSSAKSFYEAFGYIILIVSLVILGLPELVYWDDKLEKCLGKSSGGKWQSAASQAAQSFQKYMTVMVAIGLFSGLLTGLFSYAVGLNFALAWAALAFVMNFIPIIGAMIVIIPPALVAYIQFPEFNDFLFVLGGMTVIQFFVGNVVDPIYQGKFLSISPIIILISLAFWSFMWGIPGAFLAVPLTHSIMIACHHFPQTKWLACLFSSNASSCKD